MTWHNYFTKDDHHIAFFMYFVCTIMCNPEWSCQIAFHNHYLSDRCYMLLTANFIVALWISTDFFYASRCDGPSTFRRLCWWVFSDLVIPKFVMLSWNEWNSILFSWECNPPRVNSSKNLPTLSPNYFFMLILWDI